jgi:hypothetical protein
MLNHQANMFEGGCMTIQRDDSPIQPNHSPTFTPSDHDAQSSDSKVVTFQRELDELRAAHQRELERLRAETFAQLATVYAALDEARAALASRQAAASVSQNVFPVPHAASVETPATSDAPHDPYGPQSSAGGAGTSRRTLLKWGGLGAAATLAAAGASSLSMPTAHANDGGSVVLGQSNAAEHGTTISYNGSETAPVAFRATSSATNSTAVAANAGGGTSAYGVYGTAGTNGNGVAGVANGASSYGVFGTTDSGYGVVGTSNSGIDIAALGSGRLWQKTASFPGAPTSGTYATGEQMRDSAGNLFICITGGSPGIWKQVLTVSASFNGGMIGFLSTPIRVNDSRTSNNPLVGNGVRNVTVAGVNIGGVQVPKGSVGCIGNLTVARPTTGGYLVIYPAGSPTPSSSTVNYVTGQTIPNSFAVGLSAAGQVTVHAFQSGNCHFNVDITGFVS